MKKIKNNNIQYMEDGEIDGQWCIILEQGNINLCQYLEGEKRQKLYPRKAVCIFKDLHSAISPAGIS